MVDDDYIMKLASKETCTGCNACAYICPRKCIDFKDDKTFNIAYPVINENECINCGKCSKICPAINPIEGVVPLKAYAAWSSDTEERRTSASGGIGTEIYKYALDLGWNIVGATFDNDFQVCLKVSDKLNSIKEFKNSKYVFSSIKSLFQELDIRLKSGDKIVVIALPCQIAAIKKMFYRYLDNLLLVDLVCHGVAPADYLIQHIRSIEYKKDNKAVSVFFRYTAYSTDTFKFTLYNAKNDCFYAKRTANRDSYQVGYHRMISYRENCYHCQFARQQRISDITISDYKGLGKYAPSNIVDNRQVSCILVNTDKGKNFIDNLLKKGNIVAEERPVKEPIEGDKQLQHPSQKSFARKIFERRIRSCDGNFECAMFPIVYIVSFQHFLYRVENVLKRIILKILKTFRCNK